jgi:large conductance mechanosensitive channel
MRCRGHDLRGIGQPDPDTFNNKTRTIMLKEFREFAMRGNVVDMAVGIIIGGAFGTIVKSLVADVIMPPIGLLLGGVDFADFFVVLKEGATAGPYATLAAATEAGAVTLGYGLFVNAVISFVIVAFAVFLLIKSVNKMKRQEAAAPAEPTTKECPKCCSTIPIKATRCPHCTSEI